MISRTVIRASQSGWVVSFNGDLDNLHVFRSDEPERFIRFITEKVAGIKIDQVISQRQEEIERARARMDKDGSVYHAAPVKAEPEVKDNEPHI